MLEFFDKNSKGLIFDTHAHYDDERFNSDRDELLRTMHEKGVCCIINCATSSEDIEINLNLAKKYDFVYTALGFHPEYVKQIPENETWLYDLAENLKKDKVVALGEVGLDYYWEKNAPREVQKYYFEKQLQLAYEIGLPVIMHDREAHSDTFELLKKYKPYGVLHCFSGSVELANEAVKLGIYIGLGGVVTFKNARHIIDIAKNIDEKFLLLETDAPYMSPEPYRGSRNNSLNIIEVAKKIAALKGTTTEDILIKCRTNASSLFAVNI